MKTNTKKRIFDIGALLLLLQISSVFAQRATSGLIPLTEMSAADRYKGEDGGLYGRGQNMPPAAQLRDALAAAKKITPLGQDGKPSAQGKIVLLSIGMSNTSMEFTNFKKKAENDLQKSPNVVLINGAQNGQGAELWIEQEGPWNELDKRLDESGISPSQVQVVWLKHASMRVRSYGEFPNAPKKLQLFLTQIINKAKRKYPNLQIAYLGCRIYGGYSVTNQFEPIAYESVFADRWVILDQISGSADLNHDPAKGDVRAPVVLWGPYLWADGVTPRKSDGMIWARSDIKDDGVHPAATGMDKVGNLLLNFFKTDQTAKSWFLSENR